MLITGWEEMCKGIYT